MKIEILISNHH